MKRIIFILLSIVILAAIFYILRSNKNTLDMRQDISESELQKIPVTVDTVKKLPLGFTLSFAGILEPADKLMVMSQTEGSVVSVNFSLGERVTKGQTVVKVDDELLKVNLEVAQANYEKALKDLQRFEKMIDQGGVTRDQLEKMRLNEKNARANLANLKKRLDLTSVEAPFTGYINQIFTQKGALLGKGIPVFELVNIDQFDVRLNLSEEEILKVHQNMNVTLIPKSMDTLTLTGTIKAMARSADRARQYPIEIVVNNPFPELLKGGLLVRIRIQDNTEQKSLAVKRTSIRNTSEGSYVFLARDSIAIRKFITTGKRNEDYIEVTQGINPNDLVITSGIDKLEDKSTIKIIDSETMNDSLE